MGAPGLESGVATNSLLTSNLRYVKIFNGQLYVSTGSGGSRGISSVGTGLPTNGTPATTVLINLGGSASPYDFEFNPAMTVAYVTEDSSSGGIIKYTNNGSAWFSNYTLPTISTANVGARGLAVDWSGPNPVIYATTAENSTNRIIRIVDTNSAATAVTLATALTNTAFRGLAFTPMNSPVAPVIIGQTTLGNGDFQITFTGPSGQTYKVVATTDLTQPIGSWTQLSTGTFGAIPAIYTDAGAASQPQRFYRVISP